jgi:hypothetical protein
MSGFRSQPKSGSLALRMCRKSKEDLKARIQELEGALEQARQLVTEANNSLYGSQGYFHSLNGGPFDKHHLSRGIEDLKAENNRLHALQPKSAK